MKGESKETQLTRPLGEYQRFVLDLKHERYDSSKLATWIRHENRGSTLGGTRVFLNVVAPCLEIPTTDRQGAGGYTPTDYDLRFNGTSSATPHVAALAGLVISVNPAVTNAEVRAIISESTDKINTPP